MRMLFLTFSGLFLGAALIETGRTAWPALQSGEWSWLTWVPAGALWSLVVACGFAALRGLSWPFFELEKRLTPEEIAADPFERERILRLQRQILRITPMSGALLLVVGLLQGQAAWVAFAATQFVMMGSARKLIRDIEALVPEPVVKSGSANQ